MVALIEDVDIIQQQNEQHAATFAQFMDNYSKLDCDLCQWLEKHAPVAELEELKARGYETLTADDFVTAQVMCTYWVVCILTYGSFLLALRHAPLPEQVPDVTCVPERTNAKHYCYEIADIIGVWFQEEAGEFSKHSTAFTIGVALMFLLSTGEVKSEVTEKLFFYLERCNQRSPMGRLLKSAHKEWPDRSFLPPRDTSRHI
jgi:hypothetical protein